MTNELMISQHVYESNKSMVRLRIINVAM